MLLIASASLPANQNRRQGREIGRGLGLLIAAVFKVEVDAGDVDGDGTEKAVGWWDATDRGEWPKAR